MNKQHTHGIMARVRAALAISALLICPSWATNLVGLWEFENSSDLGAATIGTDLGLTGAITSTAGSGGLDAGAANVAVGDYIRATNPIGANGTGLRSNEYTLLIDFKIPALATYISLVETTGGGDGDYFYSNGNGLGVSNQGYVDDNDPPLSVLADTWHRLMLTVDLAGTTSTYVDGTHIGDHTSTDGVDSRWSLGSTFDLFSDNGGGEEAITHVSNVALFDTALDATGIASLGTAGMEIFEPAAPPPPLVHPYLQSSTPSSITINWHEAQSTESIVYYGTTDALGQSTIGDTHTFDASTLWHRVQLTGLQPDTEYFYQCKTGTAESDIHTFRTFPSNTVSQGHFRIGILGDTRTDRAQHTQAIDAMREKVESLYGTDVHNQLNLVLNVGDIVTSGGSLGQYQKEYFGPIESLSTNVPFMVSIGNHEVEAAHYYNYMNYEDFGGSQGEKYYSFRAGPILLLAINSNSSLRNQTQLDWIEAELIAAQADESIDWVLTFCHHPGRSELWPSGNTGWVNNDVIPLLAGYNKVCGLYYGHSHNFEMGAHLDAPFYLMLNGGGGSVLDNWGDYANQTDYQELYKSWDHFGYSILDFDLANRSYTAQTFSLGHQHKSLDNVLIDEFYQKRENTSAPQTPQGLSPVAETVLPPVLVASPYTGVEGIMSSHFQLTSTSGNYSSPIVDNRRDWVNFYGDTGSPDYNMVDLNDGIDLGRLVINSGVTAGNTYFWRVRYRDQNLVWSEWSAEQSFTVNSGLPPSADFGATPEVGYNPLSVRFIDLSIPAATLWSWDLDGDGSPDSTERDPEWTYTNAGDYDVTLTIDGGSKTEIKLAFIQVAVLPEGPLLSVQSGTGSLQLTWSGNAAYSSYLVYTAPEPGGPWELLLKTTENHVDVDSNTTKAFYRVAGVLN